MDLSLNPSPAIRRSDCFTGSFTKPIKDYTSKPTNKRAAHKAS